MPTTTTDKVYLSAAETAKLVRKALKGKFPGVKFSVRSSTYSGGASVSIGWTDGPTTAEVDAVTGIFAGASFDGMIDLKTYSSHWLHPDGTVTLAHAPGTEGSRGSLPEQIGDPNGPTAQLVSLGADFVITQRRVSDEWRDEILDEFERVSGRTIPREGQGYWQTKLPLSVDRLTGELLRMVDWQEEYVQDVFHRYTATHGRQA